MYGPFFLCASEVINYYLLESCSSFSSLPRWFVVRRHTCATFGWVLFGFRAYERYGMQESLTDLILSRPLRTTVELFHLVHHRRVRRTGLEREIVIMILADHEIYLIISQLRNRKNRMDDSIKRLRIKFIYEKEILS